MKLKLSAFQVYQNGKPYDYRLGGNVDIKDLSSFFSQKYLVKNIGLGTRHALGILEKKHQEYFLKLATTKGISILTEIEYKWNDALNKQIKRKTSNFWVPLNKDCGYYKNDLFYLITDKFDGNLLSPRPAADDSSELLENHINDVIEFSEIIQNLSTNNLEQRDAIKNNYHVNQFVEKTRLWYNDVPESVTKKYNINKYLSIVENTSLGLQKKPRHGDFAPWHIFKIKNGKFGLIDGEHAKTNGVEYYDICYLIQRIFSVLKKPRTADAVFNGLKNRNYNLKKLKTVLLARGIGGFLDESLTEKPDYGYAESFCSWVLNISK